MTSPRWHQPGAWLKALSTLNSAIAALLFAALTLVVTLQVLSRFVFHAPMIWSEEAARFLFFWVVMLGAAMSVRTRRHFVIDITSGHAAGWGRKGRFLFDIVPGLCILAFSVFLLVLGIGYARVGLLRTATNSQVSMGVVYAAIPVFAVLSVAYSIANLLQDYAAFVQGRAAAPRPPTVAE
jgi:TRAP-type C4-dicarboxylate transport system permease small subunit